MCYVCIGCKMGIITTYDAELLATEQSPHHRDEIKRAVKGLYWLDPQPPMIKLDYGSGEQVPTKDPLPDGKPLGANGAHEPWQVGSVPERIAYVQKNTACHRSISAPSIAGNLRRLVSLLATLMHHGKLEVFQMDNLARGAIGLSLGSYYVYVSDDRISIIDPNRILDEEPRESDEQQVRWPARFVFMWKHEEIWTNDNRTGTLPWMHETMRDIEGIIATVHQNTRGSIVSNPFHP